MIPSDAAAPSARSTLADQRTASNVILVSILVGLRAGIDRAAWLVLLPVVSIGLSVFAMWLSRINYTERDGKLVPWRHPRSMFVCAAAAGATSLAGLLAALGAG